MSVKTQNRETRKPFHAYVGAFDLAVAKTRELPIDVITKAATFVPKTTTFVFELPSKAKTLRHGIETRSTTLTNKASDFYGDLAVRGEKLVTSIRRQESTQAAVKQVKIAKAQTKGAATTASHAAKSVTTRTKAATTSASKAATKTTKAVEDAAKKVG